MKRKTIILLAGLLALILIVSGCRCMGGGSHHSHAGSNDTPARVDGHSH